MSTLGASLSRELGALTGGGHVLDEAAARRYALDGVAPGLAVRPGTLEELSRVVRTLSEAGAACIPWGGGSHAHVGLPPSRYDVALLLDRLDALAEYDPDDLTAGAAAGLRFRDLQLQLARHNQWLALDPPGAADATLGGLFASGRIGPRRMSAGAPRDKVLGMTVVLADGTVTRTGGRVVKNVSGYDLHRLYTGSCGTLAVIAQVHVRLAARPEARRTLLYRFPAVRGAGELLAGLRASRLEPAAIELLDAPSARAADARGAGTPWRARVDETAWTLAVLFEGATAEVEAQQRALQEFTAPLKPVALEGGFSEEFWKAVAEVAAPSGTGSLPDGRSQIFAQASVLPRDVAPLAEAWDAGLSGDGHSVQIHAHAGSGHVHVRLAAPGVQALAAAWQRMAGDLKEHEGTGQLLDAPTAMKRQVPLWIGAAAPHGMMKSLKDALDPRGLLSPGRMPFDV